MQRKITIIVTIILSLQSVCFGQYIQKLDSILSGSIQNRALDESFKSDSLNHRRGLNPSDPEFDISYFFSDGFEANLKAELDMPSVYRQRNKISKYNIEKSDAVRRLQRLDLLSTLSDKYLELVYNIKLQEFITKMMPKDSMEYFNSTIEEALANGDITMLDYTDLQMILKSVKSLYQQCENDINILTNDIRLFSQDFTPCYGEDFPDFDFHNLSQEEFVEKAYDQSSLKDVILNDSLIAQRELKLARWEWSPKIVLGARLDMSEDRTFSPAAVGGLSIPLWENRGNIKYSKANIKSVATSSQTRKEEFCAELKNLYEKYNSACERISTWENYNVEQHVEILHKAYSLGRITASEYYLKVSNILSNVCNLYHLQHEKAATSARMAILLNNL